MADVKDLDMTEVVHRKRRKLVVRKVEHYQRHVVKGTRLNFVDLIVRQIEDDDIGEILKHIRRDELYVAVRKVEYDVNSGQEMD